jgi:subtilase family serine protease
VILHQAPYELPLLFSNDSGVPFDCFLFHDDIACHAASLPTNTTSQFTFYYQTPTMPGTYQMFISVDSYKWTEFDETNNSLTLTYTVG